MFVINLHDRSLATSPEKVGALIDTLGTQDDRLWPRERWPSIRFDRPLQVGAKGGHGPIRYEVEAYSPGRLVRFRFSSPRGFDGTHMYEVVTRGKSVTLRHLLKMNVRRAALLTWPLFYGPLHDALIEDSLDNAERAVASTDPATRWSRYVRVLRWLSAAWMKQEQR